MKNFFTLQTMWSTKLITAIYWLSLTFILVSGLAVAVGSGVSAFGLFSGIGIVLVGAVSVRLWCELFIVFFRIHDNLEAIADKIDAKDALQAPTAD